jgi:betaine reductase
MVGAHRIVPGLAITHPVGNPDLPYAEEREVRRMIVLRALEALQDNIFDKKVFDWQS